MTYFQFHLIFIFPLLLLLSLWTFLDLRQGLTLSGSLGRSNRFAFWVIAAHIAIALIYTTPWDNYLVFRQVWGYPEGRVLFTIGYVPIEEYLFFILQTILTSLLLYALARRLPAKRLEPAKRSLIRWLGASFALGLASLGVICLAYDRGTYLGLILVWAGPVLALQWGFGADLLWARWRLVIPAIAMPSVYLWLVDRLAIGLGIWWISPELSTGFKLFGLPIEEAVFFLLTNVFVVFGLILALNKNSLPRIQAMQQKQGLSWWKALLGLWLLSMIPMPLFSEAFTALTFISTSLLALGVLGYALEHYGQRAWLLFLVAIGFGLLVEWLGKTTGIPFGNYSYAQIPSLFGVPLFVPLGWWVFSMVALAVAPRAKLFLAPLVLVSWDLGLDPLMVNKGFWTFAKGGFYYGVPLSNFIGWYLAGLLLSWLLVGLEPRLLKNQGIELQLVFLAQAFLVSVGLVYFGMPWAGLLTLFAMSSFFLPRLRYLRQKRVSAK